MERLVIIFVVFPLSQILELFPSVVSTKLLSQPHSFPFLTKVFMSIVPFPFATLLTIFPSKTFH
jgi:hypothetical protein